MAMGLCVVGVHIIWLIIAFLICCCCNRGGSEVKKWYKMAFFVQLPSHLVFAIWGIWMVGIVQEDNSLLNKALDTIDDLEMFDDCSYHVLKMNTEDLKKELEKGE